MLLDSTMSPQLKSVNGSGSIRSGNFKVSNIPALELLAKVAGNGVDLNKIEATEVTVISFVIENGNVITKPFDIKLGKTKLTLSGMTGLDQTIDYRGTITIPDSAGKVAKLGTVDMTIGGTFKSPTVGIDMESLAKKTASNALQELGNKLLGGKKQESSAESGDASTASATEDATEETPQTEQEKKVEDVKTLVNVAKGLFKKKN
jgi:hypothetical protein